MKIKQITNFQCPICNKIFQLESEAEECFSRCEEISKINQEILELNNIVINSRKKKKSLVGKLKNLNSEENYSIYKSLTVEEKEPNTISFDTILKIAEKNCVDELERKLIEIFKKGDKK